MVMKHEQIVLVALGYIIGFVTAFLGLELMNFSGTEAATSHASDNYGFVATVSDGGEDKPQGAAIADAVINTKGLFAVIGGEERVISAATLSGTDTAGFHYAIAETLISPDGKYLYYCAQATPDDATCESFIFGLATDSIYPVKDTVSGEYMENDIESLAISWMDDGRLSADGRVSTSAEAPWMVE